MEMRKTDKTEKGGEIAFERVQFTQLAQLFRKLSII